LYTTAAASAACYVDTISVSEPTAAAAAAAADGLCVPPFIV